MSAVLIGAAIYLTHLVKQTIVAIRQLFRGNEFELMAPFFSIPYFYLVYDIFEAMLKSGIDSLHAYESKMLIVMLYPFFITISEITQKIKKEKSVTKN